MTNNKIRAESFLVSVTFDENNKVGIMAVGRKRKNESVEIINAFEGDVAARLYKELTTVKEKHNA